MRGSDLAGKIMSLFLQVVFLIYLRKRAFVVFGFRVVLMFSMLLSFIHWYFMLVLVVEYDLIAIVSGYMYSENATSYLGFLWGLLVWFAV